MYAPFTTYQSAPAYGAPMQGYGQHMAPQYASNGAFQYQQPQAMYGVPQQVYQPQYTPLAAPTTMQAPAPAPTSDMSLPFANVSVTGAVSIPYPAARQYDTSVPGGLPGPKGDYVAELGRASWKVLHAAAEQFPPYPSPQEQQAMQMFIHSFAQVYPCLKCRIHFQQNLQKYPPDVSSQAALVKWMSFFHDQVNASFGKPQWKTQLQQLSPTGNVSVTVPGSP